MLIEHSPFSNPYQDDRYFLRMASALGDKIRIVDYLPKVTASSNVKVLDVGAGGGELSNFLAEVGYDVTAIDASDEAVTRLRDNYPGITSHKLFANEIDKLGDDLFDVVICSSILHEVFSYGDDVHDKGSYLSVVDTLQSVYRVLKQGGVLVIRDGVLPNNWNDFGTVELLEGHNPDVVDQYLKMSPFSNGFAQDIGHLVSLTQVEGSERIFEGNVRSLLEFSYTYNWGVDSYPRETQELYGVHTLDEYADILTGVGFNVTEKYSYLQPGYPEHLKTKLALKVNGEEAEWFDSNAIWVGIKPL